MREQQRPTGVAAPYNNINNTTTTSAATSAATPLLHYTAFTLGLVLQLDLLGRLRLGLRRVGRAHLHLHPLRGHSLSQLPVFLATRGRRVERRRRVRRQSVRFTDLVLVRDLAEVGVGDAHLGAGDGRVAQDVVRLLRQLALRCERVVLTRRAAGRRRRHQS